MESVELVKAGLLVSRTGLGTVEIGIADYGVGDIGLPTYAEAEHLLKSAVEMGITYFDTARAYGVAEERIGRSGIAKQESVVIGTKCAQFLEKGEDPHGKELERRIREDVEMSLRTLRVDSLQLLQLHGGNKEQIERGELTEILSKLKDEGKVQHVGITTRGEEAPLAAIESGFFETIQIAHNVLDQRMAPRVLPAAREHNIGVINRSVLLKGVLTPAYIKVPDTLRRLREHAKKAKKIAGELGTDLPTLALRFALFHSAISTALIGTTKIEHIKSAVAAADAGPLANDVLDRLYELAIDDPDIVDPAHWPKETQTV